MAKAIMVQGTTSNAGKSLITAGLCRIFAQDGYRVAPFKSQNMALNSYITEDGLEMGRAQVMQAEAANCKPDVRMNPILLKPTSHTGSQVIVGGEVLGNMSAAEYYAYKPRLIPEIQKAYDSLAAENDIVVLEGAGSPAEINLKQNDIVNMYMAKLAKAPVLLVGDIDRGGVFASLAGTVMLLPEDEKPYLKGVIINKFRGDVEILRPGLGMLEGIINRPVMGVVPYMQLDVDDEDSLSDRLVVSEAKKAIDIAVIRLPRISNFTDFNALDSMEEASICYVTSKAELKKPDLIILPGTKNTMGDLKWLRESGLEAVILRYVEEGGPLIGICGGYQMLCKSLSDPYGVEEGGQMKGMGLLDAETVFHRHKTRTRVSGKIHNPGGIFKTLQGAEFEGYEIHMGETRGNTPALSTVTTIDGAVKQDGLSAGNVYGSYIHGLFDSSDVLRGIAKALLARKGLDDAKASSFDIKAYKQKQYDILAETLRSSLDMSMIYRLLEEGMQEPERDG